VSYVLPNASMNGFIYVPPSDNTPISLIEVESMLTLLWRK